MSPLIVQQKLWSSSLELKHATLTCPVHDSDDMFFAFFSEVFPSHWKVFSASLM